jgi:hypothetical protein
VDRAVGISGVDGNCLVFKGKFSAKLLTSKSKKMTAILPYFVINMNNARGGMEPFRSIKSQLSL